MSDHHQCIPPKLPLLLCSNTRTHVAQTYPPGLLLLPVVDGTCMRGVTPGWENSLHGTIAVLVPVHTTGQLAKNTQRMLYSACIYRRIDMLTVAALTATVTSRRSVASVSRSHLFTATPVLELSRHTTPAGDGCKRLHLIRHAQGTHNAAQKKVYSRHCLRENGHGTNNIDAVFIRPWKRGPLLPAVLLIYCSRKCQDRSF